MDSKKEAAITRYHYDDDGLWESPTGDVVKYEDHLKALALLTAEPEPCEDAQWWTCPDCGARYPLTPTEKLGDEEYDGPTQYFVSQGGLRTPRVYGSRPVICACKASQVADKRAEELRAQVETLKEALKKIDRIDCEALAESTGLPIDDFTGGYAGSETVSGVAREALAATEPKI